jgi:2-polyprenyl-3-methyl-5-hydroxy-6-metoxy-1,4-benzoquinol methylase
MPSFAARSPGPELLDDPAVGAAEIHATLRELEVINRRLGGYAPSLAGIASLVPPGAKSFSLLDVGSGGGDLARRALEWAARRGQFLRVTGIDRSPAAVDFARRASAGREGLEFQVCDLFDLDGESAFDVVHAAMVLHHFDGAEAARALKKMHSLARWGLVINDLHRHPLAYYAIRVLTRHFSGSELIRNDAPLSVLRGFRRADFLNLALEAGLPEPALRWRWAFRWQVVFRR